MDVTALIIVAVLALVVVSVAKKLGFVAVLLVCLAAVFLLAQVLPHFGDYLEGLFGGLM